MSPNEWQRLSITAGCVNKPTSFPYQLKRRRYLGVVSAAPKTKKKISLQV